MRSGSGLFRFIEPPGIEFEEAANKRGRITTGHFLSGETKLERNGLAQVTTVQAPGVETGFKIEKIAGNIGIEHLKTSNKEMLLTEARIKGKERNCHAGLPKEEIKGRN